MDKEEDNKLIRAKEQVASKNAAQGKGLGSEQASQERLPPGQTLVDSSQDFPVLDLGIIPEISEQEWRLRLFGACDSPTLLDYQQLQKVDHQEIVTDFHCVTRWSCYDMKWQGTSLKKLFQLCQPQSDAVHVVFHSYDGYTTNVPIEDCMRPESFLVTHWNGRLLERKHGGPVRGMIPHLYAWKSAKWVKEIEFLKADQPGFWEVRGYHNYGDPWKEERFSHGGSEV